MDTYSQSGRVQRATRMWRAGATVSNFPTYLNGYVIHKGRSGIAAAREHRRRHPHATAERDVAHFMHAPDGADQWAEIEGRYERLLERAAEPELLEVLAERLAALGTRAARVTDDA